MIKLPTVDEKTGVPMCSLTNCPKYGKYQGRCTEDDIDDPTVCIPAVRDMVLELDARKDAADPAFDEIIALCGLAKTWEYPAQVVRDVRDALKQRDEKISELEARLRVAEAVRDDARAASQRYLDEKRTALKLLVDSGVRPLMFFDDEEEDAANRIEECECSPSFRELAPGVHAGYCPLAGLPLDDGLPRSRCEPCGLTFRAAADEQPLGICARCGAQTVQAPAFRTEDSDA